MHRCSNHKTSSSALLSFNPPLPPALACHPSPQDSASVTSSSESMTSYTLHHSPPSSSAYNVTNNSHYAMYTTSPLMSSLAGALSPTHESTPRIAVSQMVRPHTTSFYIAPITSRTFPSSYGLSTTFYSRTLSSPDSITSSTSRSDSPYQASTVGDYGYTPPATVDDKGPMLPGAVGQTDSSEDLWAHTYPVSSPSRSRQLTASDATPNGAYPLYSGYSLLTCTDHATASQSPVVGTTISPTIAMKPESSQYETEPMSFHGYTDYRSYLDLAPGTMSSPEHQMETYYAVEPSAYAPTAHYEPETPACDTPTTAFDPRDVYYTPTSASPSSLDGALGPDSSHSHDHPAAASQMDDEGQHYAGYPQYTTDHHASSSSDESISEQEHEVRLDDEYMESSGSEYEDEGDSNYGARSLRKTARRSRASDDSSCTPEPGVPVSEEFYAPDANGRRTRPRAPPNRTPLPQPIPNLTKKSRGRRVPTASGVVVKVCNNHSTI
jgi:hypothetical protein